MPAAPAADQPDPSPAPAARAPRVFLSAQWRYLAMVNYAIDPAILRPYVPAGTELDQFGGQTFVSMVGFLFLRTRLFGWPIPFHRDFEEVNLRFYVRRRAPEEPANGGWRRGAVFIREIVPRWAIARTARFFYNEQYDALRMAHRLELPPTGGAEAETDPAAPIAAEYRWREAAGTRRKAAGADAAGAGWNCLRVEARGQPATVAEGSEEEFITEHYWGYTRQRGGGTVEFQVEHPRWRVWRATNYRFECDVAAAYGERFRECLSAPASSAFLAEGSPVRVRWGRRIEPE